MTHSFRKWITPIVTALTICFALPSVAVSVSPQMVEQFKKLPASEQKRLAKQYGIDPSMLGGSSGNNSSSPQPATPVVAPREAAKTTEAAKPDEVTETVGQLKPFGYELFAGQPTTFAPATDIPVPADYVLGPGDELRLQLFGKTVATEMLTVGRDGSISISELGPMHVAGMTFAGARKAITNTISEQMIGVDASLSMGELRSIRIFIAGEAYQPGSYTVSSLSTVSHALTLAGGLSEIGSLRNIQIKRSGKVVGHFDAYQLLMEGDSSGDVRLQSGDVVFIPPIEATVSVDGEVRRPAIYELKGNQSMAEVLAMAGGNLPGAYPSASVVERFNQRHQRTIVNVDLTVSSGRAINARNGDRLIVRTASSELDSNVTVVGAVARPGHYQWQQGMRISSILRSVKSDLTWNTDLGYALVVREVNARGDIQVLGFDLQQAVTLPKGEQDLLLNNGDKVVVFSQRDESLDRRGLGQYAQKIAKHQGLQSAQLVNAGDLESDYERRMADNGSSTAKLSKLSAVEQDKQQKGDKKAALRELVLLTLFHNDKLIALSNQLTREELLHPVLAKLEAQARLGFEYQSVSIAGEVSYPGEYPLVKGATAASLIAMAGGLKESAFVERAEVTRTAIGEGNTQQVYHLNLNLVDEVNGVALTELKSRDRVNVFAKPEWQDVAMVELRGEVRFPGKYAIQKGENLADIIARAGGFTEYAYTYGGVFTRESVRMQEELEIDRVIGNLRREMANRTLGEEGNFASVEETQLVLKQLEGVQATGRMIVDFDKILAHDPKHNLMAENGDLIYIPPMRQTISVMGEVQHPSSHRYDVDVDLERYVSLAGGATRRADTERMYVVRADGSVMIPESNHWFAGNDYRLKPGDTVIMPLETNYKDSMTFWGDVTQIIYNSAVAIAAIGGI